MLPAETSTIAEVDAKTQVMCQTLEIRLKYYTSCKILAHVS